jgi:hypothetical protein
VAKGADCKASGLPKSVNAHSENLVRTDPFLINELAPSSEWWRFKCAVGRHQLQHARERARMTIEK